MNREYTLEMRERALRMLAEARPEHPNMMSAVRHVAGLLGMSPETLRLWQRRWLDRSRPGRIHDDGRYGPSRRHPGVSDAAGRIRRGSPPTSRVSAASTSSMVSGPAAVAHWARRSSKARAPIATIS